MKGNVKNKTNLLHIRGNLKNKTNLCKKENGCTRGVTAHQGDLETGFLLDHKQQELFRHLQHDVQHSAQLGGLLGETVNDQCTQEVDDDSPGRVGRQMIEHIFVQ